MTKLLIAVTSLALAACATAPMEFDGSGRCTSGC